MKVKIFFTILLAILASLIFYTALSTNKFKQDSKSSSELMGTQGTEDNPFEAAEFRYEMVTGGINSDALIGRKKAVEYMKSEMADYNTLTDAVPSAWTAKGPGNIGGRIRSILIKPGNSSVILLGAVSGGVWKSVNGGQSWTAKTDTINAIAINTMAYDPTNHNIVYAGTGEGWENVDAVYGGGILKSVDFGESWTILSSTQDSAKFRNVMKIEVDSLGNVYAATKNLRVKGYVGTYDTLGGLFKSQNGGVTFNKLILPATSNFLNPSDFAALNDSTYLIATGKYGATYGGLFQSMDRGITWTKITTTVPQSLFRRVAFGKDPQRGNVIYAVYDSVLAAGGSSLYGIFKSWDYGGTWIRLNRPADITYNTPPNYLGQQGWYDNVISVDPFDTNKVFVGGIEMMKTNDGGNTWSQVTKWRAGLPGNFPVVHADHHVIAFDPNTANTILNGNDGGIYKTNNLGNTWSKLNIGLQITQFYGGAVYKTGNTYYGGTQDNGHLRYTSFNGWSVQVGGDGGYAAQNQSDLNISFSEYIKLRIYKTIDNGSNWNPSISGLTDANSNNALFIAPFSMNPENNGCLIAGSNKVWITNDHAANWTRSSDVLSAGEKVSAVTVCKSSANYTGFAGTTDGRIFKCTNLDPAAGIDTWNSITPAGNNGAWVRRITVNLNKKNRLYACYSGYSMTNTKHVWYSADSGSTWTDITSNLPNVPVHSLIINPVNDTTLYIGTETGVFTTTNNGGDWYKFVNGMPPYVPIDELVLQTGTNKLFAFTHGRSVWEIPLDTVNIKTKLTIKLPIQGFYDTTMHKHRMSDTVRIHLRNAGSPYQFIDCTKAIVDAVNLKGTFTFSNAPSGFYYYVIKHRNSIESWSKLAGEDFIVGDSLGYDFSTYAAQVYGNNMKKVYPSPEVWAIYSGDIRRDGVVDALDLSLVDNDAYNFTVGYVGTDVNGDSFVDAFDMAIVDNNAYDFVSVVRPP